MDTNFRERKRLTLVAEKITQRVFCTACQQQQPPEGGKYKTTANGRKRFVCLNCINRASAARIASGGGVE